MFFDPAQILKAQLWFWISSYCDYEIFVPWVLIVLIIIYIESDHFGMMTW